MHLCVGKRDRNEIQTQYFLLLFGWLVGFVFLQVMNFRSMLVLSKYFVGLSWK